MEPPNNNLLHYEERKQVVLATDASSFALGAVLIHFGPFYNTVLHLGTYVLSGPF